MVEAIEAARAAGDTLGGVFEVVALELPVGLGTFVSWEGRLDGRLAGALMSIQAMKGVEVGMGFRAAASRGSQVHDEIDGRPMVLGCELLSKAGLIRISCQKLDKSALN